MGTFADLGIKYSSVTALLGLVLSAAAIFAVLGILFYVLKAAAVCDMSISLKLKNPWYSFVPIFGAFAFGRLSQRGKQKTLGTLLFCLELLYVLLMAAVAVTAIFGWVELLFAADKALAAGKELSAADFSVISRTSLPMLILMPISLARKVLYLVCSYKIFEIFDNRRALVYTLLSVVFGFLMPIFLFAIRKNEPLSQQRYRDEGISGFNFGN